MKSLLLALFLGLAAAARAGLMEPLSIDTLTTNAEVVIHGKVITKTVKRDPAGRIYTRVKLEIIEVWKGSVSPETFSIVYSGGRLGNEETRVSIPVNYEIGEEVVAMLRLNQRQEGVTLAAVQGKFVVATDSVTGDKLVSNIFHGHGAMHESGSAATASRANERITLENLKGLVKGGLAK